MASVMQDDGKKSKMAEESDERSLSKQQPSPPVRRDKDASAGEGFFTIRKKGQGYWTRMLTAVGAALLIALSAQFIYQSVLGSAGASRNVRIGVTAGFAAAASAFAWWLMNRPQSVEFLIATDSEMKKVNWTSREDLIGSTKVVILFMFMIAFFLFFIDLVFGYLFKFMTVLKFGPFG
jgi:preprotein translocase SecE subunit